MTVNKVPIKKAVWYCFLISLFALGLAFAALLLGKLWDYTVNNVSEEAAIDNIKTKRIIVDAGHGGRDGGAISVTGSAEKELNLEVSKALEALLKALGFEVIMTRDEDIALTVPGSLQSKKMQDLKARLNIMLEYRDAVFVSIHMNKFSQSKYSGLQVYYSRNSPSSAILAERIRSFNAEYLQPSNTRECKAATSNIFLLDKAPGTAVLVECGFISNPEEAELLENSNYRMKLASVICAALCAGD